MADRESRWPENAPGAFYVDEGCIDCDLCRTIAPDQFERSENGYSYVAVQPGDARQIADCEQALGECPVEAIGQDGADA